MHSGMDRRQGQVLLFSRFAHLYDAGVPLAEALSLVSGELPPALCDAVRQIVDDIYRGISLADAMDRRPEIFAPEIVGMIRAGEQRGELGVTARSAADGLKGRVLDPTRLPEADIEALLASAGDARILHLDPDGRLRLRGAGGLEDGGELNAALLGLAFARRAGIEAETGTGGFMWGDRLVRVATAATPEGLATVIRLSGVPDAEPEAAAGWRKGPPALLLVVGGDTDARLRSVLRAFDPATTKRVAIDLPAPEALSVTTLDAALALDPDVVCMARLRRTEDAERLAASGVHTVAGVDSEAPFADVPHETV